VVEENMEKEGEGRNMRGGRKNLVGEELDWS